MYLSGFKSGLTDWSQLPATEHPGFSGTASMQTHQLGGTQLRRIVYSPSYLAGHWCGKGHIILVLTGGLTLEHEDGHAVTLGPGQTYCIADSDGSPHRARSENGATILVVD